MWNCMRLNKNALLDARKALFVIQLGFEPRTPTLKVLCSTSWATESLRQLSCQLLRFRTYLFYRSANIEILLVWSNSIFGMLKSYWLSGQKFLYSDFKDIGLEKTDFGRNNFINLKISSFWIKASSASFLRV